MAGAAQMPPSGRPAEKCFCRTECNLMWSEMCSAPGMPPGMAMRSQVGAPRPATSFTMMSASMRTPREHTTCRVPALPT
eukprot:554250-Pyramimonas_sp.AAC.1